MLRLSTGCGVHWHGAQAHTQRKANRLSARATCGDVAEAMRRDGSGLLGAMTWQMLRVMKRLDRAKIAV